MKNRLKRFFCREEGQAMVEFALVLPVLLLILCGIIDFGWLFFNQLSLDNAAREAARYAVVNTTADNLTQKIEDKVESEAGNVFGDDFDVTVTFSDLTNKLGGDITVTLTADMRILTPVLGTINGSQAKTLVSTVTMKAES